MENKACIVVIGPTAIGKTSLAIRIAREFNTQIISADSRQCYRELNVGVAKPSTEQLKSVPHHFVNSHSIHEEVNAALFEQYALAAAGQIHENNNTAVVVGGTGLYIDAFCEGLDDMPVILPGVRAQIIRGFAQSGLAWLQQQVSENDPEYFMGGEISNPNRLIRSLEVKLSTGRSIRSFHSKQKKKRPFTILKLGLELPRNALYKNIDRRVDEMINNGLAEEVKFLLPYRHLNALNTVGYKELFSFFEEKISFADAIVSIKQHTRNYAKRQLTWFKRDDTISWFRPEDVENIIDECRGKIKFKI